jgi:hypothetical protein
MTVTSPSWIDDGEKYALVGLNVKLEGGLPAAGITANLSALAGSTFSVPPEWREWLGSIRCREVEGCNLFLLSKLVSATPGVLDAENQKLQQRVSNFYAGLLLASPFAPAHRPVMLTGSRQDGEIGLRQQQDFECPIPCLFRPYPALTADDVKLAAGLGENLEAITGASITGGHWRLFRTLHVYMDARTTSDIIDRIHQYSRCIDGLILPDAGKTKAQFKGRTEVFIGLGHHDLMGEIYDIRSAAEHLHENRYLEYFDRAVRLELARKEAIAEYVARSALVRVIGNDALWPHFGNTPALEKFWALPPADRVKFWGDPVDPLAAVADFDPQYINDATLGRE